MMPYSVTYDADGGYIVIRVQGRLNLAAVNDIASEAIRVANEAQCSLVLSDFREATLEFSTFDLYEVPRLLAKLIAPTGRAVHEFKRALVVSEEVENLGFFELVSRNRAQNVRVFHDYDEAKAWLLGG
jgi:hypothetical protein